MDNIVYVGSKGAMSYVEAVVTHFNRGAKEVRIKARGKSISKAVDVAEVVVGRFVKDARVKETIPATTELERGKASTKVSMIEIILAR